MDRYDILVVLVLVLVLVLVRVMVVDIEIHVGSHGAVEPERTINSVHKHSVSTVRLQHAPSYTNSTCSLLQ